MMKYVLTAFSVFLLVATTAAAQSNYRLQPGDTISIEVVEDPQLNRSVLVLPGGTINFPFAGTLNVGGQTAAEVQQAIARGIAGNFAVQPTVFVSVAALKPQAPAAPSGSAIAGDFIDIYFIGEVNQPGQRQMETGTTFLQALAQGGGFTRFAATKRVQLRRANKTTGQQSIYTIDLKALANGARIENNIELRDGDVIIVPERRLFE